MPVNYDGSLGDEESIQGKATNLRNETSADRIGNADTYVGKSDGELKQSLGDRESLFGGDSALDLPEDAMEVIDLTQRYMIERTLGKGGMGEVLLATDTRLDRKVAIKRILGEAARSRTAVNRFLTEAKSIAALNHNNIVQIYDYGRAQDGPFLIMEYVDGESLLDRCRAGALPIEEAIELTSQLCEGLGRAHAKGIIHRDIKPANILLTKDGIPKLTDFGLAKAESGDTGMTMAGAVLGTIDFMPPEQRRDASLVDARSDLWSLAATLYQLVTGKSPKIIKFNDVPKGLQAVLGKALEDAKEDRYQSAKEFQEALRQSLRDTSPDDVVVEQGQCPNCKTKNESHRRFCCNPKCGTSLEVSCLSCATKIPIWEEVCGSCGGKQEELATARRRQKDSERLKAQEALEANDFSLARSLAIPLAEEQDPRLQQSVGWARQFLEDVDSAHRDYLGQISQCLGESLQHEKAYDYSAGIRTLNQVSKAMREVAIPGQLETVAQVLSRLDRKQAEAKSLESKIRTSVLHRSFDHLLPEVERFLQLVPNRVEMVKLKEQLIARNVKLQQVRDESLAEATLCFKMQDYSGCLASLRKIDPSREDASVLELRKQASEMSQELQRLDQHISQAIELKQYHGLREVVDQYLALQSQDIERQQLREQLSTRENKRNSLAAEILKKATGLRSKSQYGDAIVELRAYPKTQVE
jgi:serine/threonine protein kinase